MAWYRVTIWFRAGKIAQGIRELNSVNVDYATNYFRSKAKEHYNENDLIDLEAALLSNHCTAVRNHIEEREQQRQDKKQWPDSREDEQPIDKSRKKGDGSGLTLAERQGLKKEGNN